MRSFDDFKRYHNANYHDGDSHFDERIYSKSNDDDFDCSFVQDCFDHFEAGAASRQAKIDSLRIKLDGANERAAITLNHKNKMVDKMQAEINELRKRLAMYEREGYELVPLEPTERMLDSAYSSISDNLHYADLENIYKAMIGAVE